MNLFPTRLAASLVAFALAQSLLDRAAAQVSAYGCANPADSLFHASGQPSPGQILTFGAVDPTGSVPAGSLAMLQFSTQAAPGYPCGPLLPGFGLSGGPGELLIALGPAKLFALGPVAYDGANPAMFTLAIQNNPALSGYGVRCQAAFVQATGMGLTNGLQIQFGQIQKPDLHLRAISASPLPVAPGETSLLSVVIRNQGLGSSPVTKLEIVSDKGFSSVSSVPSLPPGGSVMLQTPFHAKAEHLAQNPHTFSAKVDPNGNVPESDELDNELASKKPLFVVEPILLSPAAVLDHDEVIALENGSVTSFARKDYGPAGAPSVYKAPFDPQKGQPHPETGHVEVLGQGPQEAPKIHQDLILIEQSLAAGQFQEYVVDYEHGVPMPRLPDLNPHLPRFAAENLAVLELRMAMIEGIRRARIESVADLTATIAAQGSEVLEHFTLAGAMLVRGKHGLLSYLNGHPQVDHVERVSEPESAPPGDASDGRDLIGSDKYYDLGGTGVAYTANLDSGIRSTHTLFTGPDHIDFEEDCVYGNGDCDDTGNVAYDADDVCNHGTAVAAIYTGNSDLGDAYRGVSSGTLDSFKVYASCFLDTPAVHRGYDEAVLWGDKIVIAEIQSSQGHKGSIADDADDAYDAGVLSIAAGGNQGPSSGSINSPASAHKALGVASYDVDTLVYESVYCSRGPTPDDRIKPDLAAPTNAFTASSTSSTAVGSFGGTSGATPFAAGAASVYSDWFGLNSITSADAGKIYAALINAGPNDWDTPFGSTTGVGSFELPQFGTYYTGSRTLENGQSKFVEIYVPSDAEEIDVAIWWPENQGWTHRDIDLYLLKPDGTTSDSSLSVPSVFEHTRVFAPLTSGYRDVEIYGYDIPWLKQQTVYFSVFVKH